MNIIWANRLIAGTKTWAEMPASRRAGVKKFWPSAWQRARSPPVTTRTSRAKTMWADLRKKLLARRR